MKLTEAIEEIKKLPVERLLKTALKSENDHWIYLTLVISPSDFEPTLLLQDTPSVVAQCNDVYRGVSLDLDELFSDKWCLADPTTGAPIVTNLTEQLSSE